MKTVNQVFIQLREADKYARAKNPHLRRLSVVLLDNIVEVQLFRKADLELYADRTTWFNGVRKQDKKARKAIGQRHPKLLDFAKDAAWITDDDVKLLEFAHRVRNKFYHEGRNDVLDAELAIRFLYRFIRQYFPDWRSGYWGVQIAPYSGVRIDLADEDKSGFRPMLLKGHRRNVDITSEVQTKAYWRKALHQIMRYRPRGDIRKLIHRKITDFLDQVDGDLYSIQQNNIDFNWVLGERFAIMTPAFTHFIRQGDEITDPNAVINIYMAVLKAEEDLFDVDSPVDREKQFFDLIKNHKYVKTPITEARIEKYRKQAEKVLAGTIAEGIATFLKIESELRIVAEAVHQFNGDIELWAERELDRIRGK